MLGIRLAFYNAIQNKNRPDKIVDQPRADTTIPFGTALCNMEPTFDYYG